MMPEMNGYQVLARLKADARCATIPVIMISGLRETDSVVRCIEAGADDYLPKPFNPVLLRARIGACLERKRWRDRELRYLAELHAEKARPRRCCTTSCPRSIVARLNSRRGRDRRPGRGGDDPVLRPGRLHASWRPRCRRRGWSSG